MEDKSLELLTEQEFEFHKRFEQCKTMEELLQLEKEYNCLNENADTHQYRNIDMHIEEFKTKYGLIDINDLKGKYGF